VAATDSHVVARSLFGRFKFSEAVPWYQET
jgi:hypothetical protein